MNDFSEKINNLAIEEGIPLKKTVFFHKNCKDGIGAAYASRASLGNEAQYIPLAYGEKIEDIVNMIPDKGEVYFVDFSLKKDEMIQLSKKAKSIVVIDHHASAKDELVDMPDNVKVDFNMDKSGAVMAWEYFHNEPVPEILLHIQDGDLWKWELEGSEIIAEGLKALIPDNDIDVFARFAESPSGLSELQKRGEILLELRNKKLNEIIEKISHNQESFEVNIGGTDFILFNLTDRDLTSAAGNRIAETFGLPAALYGVTAQGDITVSLRSTEEIGSIIPVSIAFGGGGHPLAAGLKIKHNDFSTLMKNRVLSAPSSQEPVPSLLDSMVSSEKIKDLPSSSVSLD